MTGSTSRDETGRRGMPTYPQVQSADVGASNESHEWRMHADLPRKRGLAPPAARSRAEEK